MLERARPRCPNLAAGGRLYQMDVTSLAFPTAFFDAAVSSFLFCVLPDPQQVPALRELGRVVKPGGLVACWNMSDRAAACAGLSPTSGNPDRMGLWGKL
jgi:ubiquinone/menaquinone biosynthesis C-methylase UbiE